MNIALISREYPPFFGGGIGSYTERNALALAAAGHRPVVITVSADGRETRAESDGVTVVRLPFLDGDNWSAPHPSIRTPRTLAAFRAFHPVSVFAMQVAEAMPRLAREFALDAIEAPDTGALAWFLLSARRTGQPGYDALPPITTVTHSPTEWIAHWNRAPLRTRPEHELAAMERDQARWSDALVSPSRALADWAGERWSLPRERIAVIPYALGELEQAARDAANLKSDIRNLKTPQIVFTGRLEPRKGVDTLIAAFARLPAGPELHLVGEDMTDPSGRGRFGAGCIARLHPGVTRRIHAHGKTEPSAAAAILRSASVAAIPAPMDNFPLTCVEAMARGKLIVSAAAGGMAEMIRDGVEGLLFAPGDEASCADALRRALSMPPAEATAMGARAARRILDLCGNEAVVAARIAHYRSAAVAQHAPSNTPPALVVSGGSGPGGLVRLSDALARCGADFVHGWTSRAGAVNAFGTPTTESLALARAPIGPLALTPQAAADPRIHPCLGQSTRALAAALCAAGYSGTVVPDVATELRDRPVVTLGRRLRELVMQRLAFRKPPEDPPPAAQIAASPSYHRP